MLEKNQSEKANRTLICSVVFLDIVQYSSQSVSKQMELKERMGELIAQAIKDIAESERIMVDSGDGVALCFLGDPEDALFVAIHLRDLQAESAEKGFPLNLRMGINLGPVRTIKDINNRLNVIGDGINVAQRVMSFADPGKILVSRSYFEMVSRLSEEYSNLFHYLGITRDKHIREHEIYEVSRPGSASMPSSEKKEIASHKSNPKIEQIPTAGGSGKAKPKIIVATKNISSSPVKVGIAAVAIALVFGLTLKSFFGHKDQSSPPLEAAPISTAETPEPGNDTAQNMLASKDGNAPADKKPVVSMLVFAVSPWGEIYIDGKKRGISPPMSRLKVEPGRYIVKIANGTFRPYIKTIEVHANQTVYLKYKFK